MGLIDKDSRRELPQIGADVLALRDSLDRWLERFFEEPWGFPALGDFPQVPSSTVHETDTEVIVTTEVPGLDGSELDLTVTPAGLVIRAEQREETKETRGDPHVSARQHGRFASTISLPDGIDVERAHARVDRGVLTVRLPKLEGRSGRRRIPVST
jgi:HSP20 family protein